MLAPRQMKAALVQWLWDTDTASLPYWHAAGITLVRIGYVALRDLADGQLTLRAMSLVYTTLLSLVPLIAVSFSVLKAFGVHNQIEPLLYRFLMPLGSQGQEITSRIIEFVNNIKAGVLGSIGLAFLLYTVVALIQKVERAFNYTWHVEHTRRLARRFSDYLSVIIVGPVLVFSAMGLTASLMNTGLVQHLAAIAPFGTLLQLLGRALPYLLIIVAFTFAYVFVPNTRVRLGSALIGGIVAGILWETTGWAFTAFVVSSVKYTAIYSAFATLVLFMIWLYLAWIILLLGASIAFYHQYPQYLRIRRRTLHLSNRLRERVALQIMYLIGRRHYQHQPALTAQQLAQRLRLPLDVPKVILDSLERCALLVETAAEPPTYLPGRPLEDTTLAEVIHAIRSAGEEAFFSTGHSAHEAAVDTVMDEIAHALDQALQKRTLKAFVLDGEPVMPVSRTSPDVE